MSSKESCVQYASPDFPHPRPYSTLGMSWRSHAEHGSEVATLAPLVPTLLRGNVLALPRGAWERGSHACTSRSYAPAWERSGAPTRSMGIGRGHSQHGWFLSKFRFHFSGPI